MVLREHFRCAPEIISFSNDEFYNGSLIPLRLPTSSERLTPSLIDVRLRNGKKTGKVNEKECDEIIERVRAYVSSAPSSSPRSIGIISLVGDEQSRLIRGRLLSAIGPKKYKEHNILIGDPPTFQGAERDIIFLSLVCSPGSVPTQNQLMHSQRANVALSRARDRMVLVRSIDSNHIPNDQDIKFAILNFFEHAAVSDAEQPRDNGNVQMVFDQISDEFSSSPLRSYAERILARELEQKRFTIRSMGVVWFGAICVENPENSARAAICVEGSGESQEEWLGLVEQQKSIERVGWKCLRLDILYLLNDLSGATDSVIDFLSSNAVFPTPPRVDDIPENDEAIDRDIENRPQAEVGIPLPPLPPPLEENAEVVVVSSDDEEVGPEDSEDDGDRKPSATVALKACSSSFAESLGNGEAESDYGNVVALDFLRGASMTRSPKSTLAYRHEAFPDDDPVVSNGSSLAFPANETNAGVSTLRTNPRATVFKRSKHSSVSSRSLGRSNNLPMPLKRDDLAKNDELSPPSSSEDTALSSSEGDDFGEEMSSSKLSTTSSKRRRPRLDKYARDGRWYPPRKSAEQEEDDVTHEEYLGDMEAEDSPSKELLEDPKREEKQEMEASPGYMAETM